MLAHVHALVKVQEHCSCVHSESGRSVMCRLACSVCGEIAAVVLSPRRYFDFALWRISLDWHGIQ